FRSLAKRFISIPSHGSVWNRVNGLVQAAVEYKVDGFINYSPVGCRISRTGVPHLNRELNRLGIPCLELVGDNIDYRNYS
ncbi:2-hydroxyacyl-CoA dehydratase family protein, partial [Klebsiella variicola]|uniref:2-hydroxyacyl-CoA dehydratase family protein n=1 Tax=Klebsiella variicola TaxID=244366 RepID=UPI0027303D62